MTPEQLDAIRADLDRRVPARDLADRDHCRALLAEVRQLRAERDALWAEAESKSCLRCTERVRAERDRLAATLNRVRAALAGHPHCDRHTIGPIACGWKQAVLDVQAAIEGTDS